MSTTFRPFLAAAAVLTLLAGPAFAQDPAKPADQPAGKDDKNVRDIRNAGAARANKDVLKPVAFEEARYRKRKAQLDRIEQIATERQNEKLLAEVAELREKNNQHHIRREDKLRTQFGDEKVDASMAFLEKHGKGKPVMPPRNAKAREAMKNETGDKAREKIKDVQKDADKARERAKDKPDGKPDGNPDQKPVDKP